jgi:hypothetical protein
LANDPNVWIDATIPGTARASSNPTAQVRRSAS